jgi:hypothetical protein
MTRKRFIKLAISEGMTRDEAIFAAMKVLKLYGNYKTAYNEFCGMIRGRFEIYMQGHEKILAKRNKKYFF